MSTALGVRQLFAKKSFLLFIAFFVFCAGAQDLPATKRVRDRDACGVYLSQAKYQDGNRSVDNTNGIKISELNLKSFWEALQTMPEIDGHLMLSGLPIYGKERREFERGVRELLRLWKKDLSKVRVVTVPKPGGPAWKKFLEEIRYFFPLKSDYQTPVRQEVIPGLLGVAISDSSIIWYAFNNFDSSVAIPMVATATGANAALTTYMRAMTNWQNRSEGRRTERFLKQAIPATFFVGAYYFTAIWPEGLEHLQNVGLVQSVKDVPAELLTFFKEQGTTIAAHTAFFTATFAGINLWDQERSQTPEGNEQVRRARPILQTVIFFITGPILTMASTSPDTLLQIGEYIKFNKGHMWMAINGSLGLLLWKNPQVLNVVGPVVDTLVYKPLAFMKGIYQKVCGTNAAPEACPVLEEIIASEQQGLLASPATSLVTSPEDTETGSDSASIQ